MRNKTNINGLWRFYDDANNIGGIVVGNDTEEARMNASAYIREFFDDIKDKDPQRLCLENRRRRRLSLQLCHRNKLLILEVKHMEFLTKTGTFAPDANAPESVSCLEVYRLSENEINEIEEQIMPTDAIMEYLGFENPRYLVEPGAWYLERNFVAYNTITGLLVIEVRKSLNI